MQDYFSINFINCYESTVFTTFTAFMISYMYTKHLIQLLVVLH